MIRLTRFIDFCVCLCYFPGALRLARLLKVRGLHSIAEKIFLYAIAKDSKVSGDILEIGSFAGASSLLLALGNEGSRVRGMVWLVEPDPQPAREEFLRNFREQGLDSRIKLLDMTSERARRELNASFRFIFIDGNHEYEYVRKDIELWQDRLQPGGIIAFHDSEASSVRRAIDELICGPAGYVTLGTVASIFYASRGACPDGRLVRRMNALSARRQNYISIARRLGLKTPGANRNCAGVPLVRKGGKV